MTAPAALRALELMGHLRRGLCSSSSMTAPLPVSELLRIRADYLQSDAFFDFYNAHGFDLAIALHYHRISLSAIDRLASFSPLQVP